jgi:hypothetical protein
MKRLIFLLMFCLMPAVGWGAEFLVIADTKNSGDKYQIGNPVSIRPDGWKWGTGRRPGTFVIVKCPGMTVAEGRKYMESDVTVTGEGEHQVETVNKVAKYRFNTTRVLNAQTAKSDITVDIQDFDKEWTDTTKETLEP